MKLHVNETKGKSLCQVSMTLIAFALISMAVINGLKTMDQIISIDISLLRKLEPEFNLRLKPLTLNEVNAETLSAAKRDSVNSGVDAEFWYAVRVPNSRNLVLVFMRRDVSDTYILYRVNEGGIVNKCEVNSFSGLLR